MTREADRNLALAAADRRIARCTCGTWLYGDRPCGTCAHIWQEAAA